MHYSGRMDKNRAEGKGNRPPRVAARRVPARRRERGHGVHARIFKIRGVWPHSQKHVQKVILSLMAALKKKEKRKANSFSSYDLSSFVS